MLQLFDTVALLESKPDLGLERGQVGAVVEIYNHGEAFEVEFSDNSGRTYALAALRPEELLKLVHDELRVA
jgi:hypothetical protein